ncbi:YheV family putative zinc ribbon protein [Acinetobacter sp. MD2(2019)]|uniref:YheV family putative zinc ribbon protein n=1 Tax=Acinetobacter sp. MD2(2019) TaxID=2605273 RepID=UPI002D1EF89E|nr:YheV family putative zinc ribbon protein [Acinetobacter sp. MD2(2019)]MEB3753004.1 YheV family putative metal-binding protein [Acinetobacter sp. MD2(2019)]
MKRRFIAGAKCPKCDALDRVVMLSEHEHEWIECVECGYNENRPTKADLAATQSTAPDEIGVIQFRPR